MKKKLVKFTAGLALLCMAGMAQAAPISFKGKLSFVETDIGGAVYFGIPIGTIFYGMIDDDTINGHITDGTTRTDFGCCIAAGGLSIENDMVLEEDDAYYLNSVFDGSKYTAGNIIDLVNIEGDDWTSSGNRIEIGLSYILDSNAFDSSDLSNYPFDPADVKDVLFFIVEENDNIDVEIYNAAGPVVPLPASIWLLGFGLASLVGLKKKK